MNARTISTAKADKLFWLGRYAERTYLNLHFLRAYYDKMIDGDSPLVLQEVKASCGCTTPEWTKTPIAPGKTGVVKATYNATGRPGAFNKTITVKSNAGETKLTIKGEVSNGKSAPAGEDL